MVSESTPGVLIRRTIPVSNSVVLGLHVPDEEMALYKGAYVHASAYVYE